MTDTNEALAERVKADINEIEARLKASSNPLAPEALEMVEKAHRKLNRAHRKMRDGGEVQPFSSGGDKPDDNGEP